VSASSEPTRPPHAPDAATSLHAALRSRFGHAAFRPGQEKLIRAVLGGRDALGLLPTGGGKSLTYLLPAGLLRGITLVVSPLIALMADQLERARACGLRAEALAGRMRSVEVDRILGQAERRELDLLLLAPERLAGRWRARLEALPTSLLVVDEAHCVVQWGYDFRPDYLALSTFGPRLGVPTLALTATATPPVRAEIERLLGLGDPVRVTRSFDRPNLTWRRARVRDEADRWRRLHRAVRSAAGPVLVYVATRGEAERLAEALIRTGLPTRAYHAGRPPGERAEVQRELLSGGLDRVVCTSAFGMGVDKPDIRRVVHWRPPGSLEMYYQEAGRAGRDGDPSDALLLWHPRDVALLRRRVDDAYPTLWTLAVALARSALNRRRAALEQALASKLGPGGDPDPGRPTEPDGTARALERVSLAGPYGGPSGVVRARRAALQRLGAVRAYLTTRSDLRTTLLAYLGEPL